MWQMSARLFEYETRFPPSGPGHVHQRSQEGQWDSEEDQRIPKFNWKSCKLQFLNQFLWVTSVDGLGGEKKMKRLGLFSITRFEYKQKMVPRNKMSRREISADKRWQQQGKKKQVFKLFLGSYTTLQMSQRTILSKCSAQVYAHLISFL